MNIALETIAAFGLLPALLGGVFGLAIAIRTISKL